MSDVSLPACFGDAGDQAIQGAFPEGQTGTAKFPQVSASASAHGTTVDQPNRAGIPGQFRESSVIALGFEFSANRRVLLYGRSFALVSFYPCYFGHINLYL